MADDGGGGGGVGGEGGGSSECVPMDELVETMLSNSQALAEALAADRARREATDRIQRESWESALKEKDAEIDRLRAEAADAKKKLQSDASRKMRWEATYELLLGANQKLAELRNADMEDSRTCAEPPNSKDTVDHIASDLSEELRKLKQAYDTLSCKKDKEVSALLSEKDSVRNQLDIMRQDYTELLKNKKVEAPQATEAALKLQKSVDELKVLAQKKDYEIARLQAEAVEAKKKHDKDLSAMISEKNSVHNQLSIIQQDYTEPLKNKKVLTQKEDHEIVILRAEAVGAKKKVQQRHSFVKEKYVEIQRLKGWHVESVQKHCKDISETHKKSRSVDPAVTARDKLKNNNPRQTVEEDYISEIKTVENGDDDDGQSRSDGHEHSQSGSDKETTNNPILSPPGNHKRKRDACNAETANGKGHSESNWSRDMSELVKCVVYYGPGNVRSNERGADLSEFAFLELQLKAPETVSISEH